MPYQEKRMIRISAGVTGHDFPGAINYTYESGEDTVLQMAAAGYFNEARELLRLGSIIQVTYWVQLLPVGDIDFGLLRVVFPYPDQHNLTFNVLTTNILIPPPPVQYLIIAEKSLTFVTGGGPIDSVPYPESEVGMFVNYSLNSAVTDVAPPGAHQGIEYVEAQLGQIEINWGRSVAAGQTIRVWTQLRDSIPTP